MEKSEIYYWRSIAIEMAEKVQKAIAPLVGKEEAGEIIKMGADGTPTKLIDLVAEDETINVLENTGRPVTLISEEIGYLKIGEKEDSEHKIIFVVDPLDGTTNAIKSIPFYGISIAIAEYDSTDVLPSLNDVKMGFVKNFATNDIYEALRGHGAYLNGERIKPSRQESLEESSMGAFIYGTKFPKIDNICRIIRRMRILGSVALELSYVANGAYDAFMDLRGNLRVVDIAASKLIVEEAGGIVTTEKGEPLNGLLNVKERTSLIAAGNRQLHQEIMKALEVI
ncbi:MAG: bifunctional fructose-bisphosphatase/inositol-phosphate phosphatase [Methanobacteriales archaeon]|nr:bifunctional fructose-bisphosphatase/inositol-phosphate phosphatase [Methanothermobacter tenebrarum]MBC7100139.1 bifunctional fructose-bisphosphatase/inositol-phosphate phosphatase [Methanobacteriales archaeon]MBC7117570.1 bifunctional fructose-bisphosphatase/inositol-phosphate phosphatase [Methanobacteriaceae archaeon]NPV64928.1 bifunctional fructose-bisphosphatase/inositol-phosphate phosphatase [Methanobacteriaceae archaeon]